jgi:hypothetical protein
MKKWELEKALRASLASFFVLLWRIEILRKCCTDPYRQLAMIGSMLSLSAFGEPSLRGWRLR